MAPKPQFETVFVVTGAIASFLIGALVFGTLPPYPAVRGSQPLDVLTPLSYQIGVFIPFGILLGEIVFSLLHRKGSSLVIYAFVLVALCGVSLLRILFFIAISGHCLFLGYFLPYQLFTNRFRYPIRFLCGLLVLLQVLYYKFFVWDDLITPATGFLFGVGVWLISFYATRLYLKSTIHRHPEIQGS